MGKGQRLLSMQKQKNERFHYLEKKTKKIKGKH